MVQIIGRTQKTFISGRVETHTISSEDVASTPSDPRHVFKAEKSGIHPQAGATFPDATNITWTNPGQKRDCEATAHECPTVEINVSAHENLTWLNSKPKQMFQLSKGRYVVCPVWPDETSWLAKVMYF